MSRLACGEDFFPCSTIFVFFKPYQEVWEFFIIFVAYYKNDH